MTSQLLFLHSIIRYLILLFALIVSLQSLISFMGKKPLRKSNKAMALVLLICCDIQLLIGLVLYSTKGWLSALTAGGGLMKNPVSRFWAVEHGVGMVIAIVLVHMGYTFLKRKMDDDVKLKRLFWCAFIALAIFVTMTPWEGKQAVGRSNIPTLHE